MSGAEKRPQPGDWAQPDALRHRGYDRFWGLCWTKVTARAVGEFLGELTRTPSEYARNGGADWSPTLAELAVRLRVSPDVTEAWGEEGVVEPWEICVLRAYARTGLVVTSEDERVPASAVRDVLAHASCLRDAAKVTGIPLAMLERHCQVGAPANTHGRVYLLMGSHEYVEARRDSGLLAAESAEANEAIARMLAEGATIEQMANEIGITPNSVWGRMKKLGLSAARDSKGGHQKR